MVGFGRGARRHWPGLGQIPRQFVLRATDKHPACSPLGLPGSYAGQENDRSMRVPIGTFAQWGDDLPVPWRIRHASRPHLLADKSALFPALVYVWREDAKDLRLWGPFLRLFPIRLSALSEPHDWCRSSSLVACRARTVARGRKFLVTGDTMSLCTYVSRALIILLVGVGAISSCCHRQRSPTTGSP